MAWRPRTLRPSLMLLSMGILLGAAVGWASGAFAYFTLMGVAAGGGMAAGYAYIQRKRAREAEAAGRD